MEFKVIKDRKITVWDREIYFIEAENEEEFKEKLNKEFGKENDFGNNTEIEPYSYEVMFDTIEEIEPYENENNPTIEIFYKDEKGKMITAISNFNTEDLVE